MLGSMLGGAYFRSPSCRRLQSRGRLGLRPYTAFRTIAADVGPQNAGLDCASNWLASTGKSTLAVERARRARPSSDENGISSSKIFALGASSAEVAENWIVVSSSARAKRVPSCMVGSESLLHRNRRTMSDCVGARSWVWLVVVLILAVILPGAASTTLTAKLTRIGTLTARNLSPLRMRASCIGLPKPDHRAGIGKDL